MTVSLMRRRRRRLYPDVSFDAFGVSLRSFDGRVGVRGVDEGVVTSMMARVYPREGDPTPKSPRVVDFCFGEEEETFVLTLRARD